MATKAQADLDDKLGFPRVVIPVCFGDFGLFRPENAEMDWDDKPRLPRVVMPIHFVFSWPFSARKARNGLPENPKMDWDDKPGLPRVVIPVAPLARKLQNGLG